VDPREVGRGRTSDGLRGGSGRSPGTRRTIHDGRVMKLERYSNLPSNAAILLCQGFLEGGVCLGKCLGLGLHIVRLGLSDQRTVPRLDRHRVSVPRPLAL